MVRSVLGMFSWRCLKDLYVMSGRQWNTLASGRELGSR